MFNNQYYGQLPNVDRINAQIQELERMKAQVQQANVQQPSINQTFQLAPSSTAIKYVNSIDDVRKELVFSETVFFNNQLSLMWLKNTKGEIKTYELTEIIEKDDKDRLIDNLTMEIQRLKEENNAKSVNEYVDESVKAKKPTTSSANRKINE